MADFKKELRRVAVFPVDTTSPDGMFKAFHLVAETVRVGQSTRHHVRSVDRTTRTGDQGR